MDNQTQNMVRELTLDELRKVTWNYAVIDAVGYYEGMLLRPYLFKVRNLEGIHPLTIQRCNVEEGWIERIVCESYPEIEETAEFFMKAIVKRNEAGDILREKVYCDVVVDLLDLKDEVILTLSKG